MSYQVKTEKVIARSAPDVFRALKEGRLFMNCSADSRSMKIDFKVGGKYFVEFKNHGVSNWGEFLEIVPNKKIVFTWCQNFGEDQKPDTQVTIELFEIGSQTRLTVLHTGFTDKENCDNHKQGWDAGITDLGTEMQNGSLRMVRVYEAPVEVLFKVCKDPKNFFGLKGELSDIVPNQKMTLSLRDSKVSLTFDTEDDGGSSFELIHTGLTHEKDQMTSRRDWEVLSEKISETLRKA